MCGISAFPIHASTGKDAGIWGFAFSNKRCRTPVAARLSAAITHLHKFLFLPVVMGEVLRGKLVSVGFGVEVEA